MSTVLPPAAALVLPPPLLLLLLPLLLRPRAARPIATKAAIAVVRLMIFLPKLRLSGRRGAPYRPGSGSWPCGRRGWPVGEVPYRGRTAISPLWRGIPASTFRRFPPTRAAADRSASAAKFIQVRPS